MIQKAFLSDAVWEAVGKSRLNTVRHDCTWINPTVNQLSHLTDKACAEQKRRWGRERTGGLLLSRGEFPASVTRRDQQEYCTYPEDLTGSDFLKLNIDCVRFFYLKDDYCIFIYFNILALLWKKNKSKLRTVKK